jgi:hypothetical protein
VVAKSADAVRVHSCPPSMRGILRVSPLTGGMHKGATERRRKRIEGP